MDSEEIIRQEEEVREEIVSAMRAVFLESPKGQLVFEYLLSRLGLFSVGVGEIDQAFRNLAVELLNTMGIFTDGNIKDIVREFARIPRRKE